MASSSSHNLLVLSDLHLGEEMLPGSGEDRRRAVAMAEAGFIGLMRHHQRFRVDGRPWRLVVNGDLFDFMSLFVGPAEGIPVRTHDERRLGAGRREDAAIVRMRIIGARYQGVLAQMIRFVAAGHRIDIIAGNHDQELAWPSVWTEFQRALLAACPTGIDPSVALPRIVLARWFVYEPGVAWIEHGHQYDDACSWEYGLAPADPSTGELATNVDYAALRHLSSAAPDVDTHGTEEWSFAGYMRYAMSEGPSRAVRYVTSYARFVGMLLAARRAHRSVRMRLARQAAHERALDAVAADTAVPRATLAAIDGLARAPLTKSSRRLARMLRLDRMAVCLGVLVTAITALALLPAWAGVFTAACAVAGGYKAAELLGPAPAVQAAMPFIPARIQAVVDAPFVVFGHTHEPLDQMTAAGGRYLNSGTWLPAIRPGLLRAFTHVAIVKGANGVARAELRQWRDGVSRPYVERGERGSGPVAIPTVPLPPIPVVPVVAAPAAPSDAVPEPVAKEPSAPGVEQAA
jgi:UDP-2,3-diacylglucosamine pyrophosphatase LpxH